MSKENDSILEEFFNSITPDYDFYTTRTPKEPDYSNDDCWATLPTFSSVAELLPKEFDDENNDNEVDCFFIHPTGFFLKDWNFDMSKDSSTFQRTELMLATQASVFSKITNIYAPEYRQATFAAISTNQKNNSALSLELAYQDVKKSLLYYIENMATNKPLILASHSQGSLHAQRLLSEKCFDTYFKNNLIAAYLIGYPLEQDYLNYHGYEISSSEDQIKPIIQFQTIGEGGKRQRLKFWMYDGSGYSLQPINKLATTNPISWNNSSDWHESKFDSLVMPKITGPSVLVDYHRVESNESQIKEIWMPKNQEFSTRIGADGHLEAKGQTIDRILAKDIGWNKDLHIWDYQIFWNHIRKNVKKRINTFLGK